MPEAGRRLNGRRRALAALLVAVPAAALGAAAPAGPLVFAAASVYDALEAAADAYAAAGGARPRIAYGASSTLARQIERGAQADVYLAAHPLWMDWLESRGLLRAGTRRVLFGNALVVVAPASGPAAGPRAAGDPAWNLAGDLAAALGAGRLAIGDPDHVPAGIYARAWLERTGQWTALAGRLARADNVRAALALVARGEAPLGIVYRSDARSEPGVRVVAIPALGGYPRVVYPGAVIHESRAPDAERFLGFLAGNAARAIFARHGFDVLP